MDFAAQLVLENESTEISERLARLQRRAQFAGTTTSTLLRLGEPVEQILQVARQWCADVIVIADEPRAKLIASLRRSLATRLTRRATCAVHIVR